MMAEDLPAFTAEDIHNIPSVVKNLDVQSLYDESCLPLKARCHLCYIQGTGDHWHGQYRHLSDRKRSFHGRNVNGFTPQYLAETGLFQTANGSLTCYQCGQTLRLMAGDDPLEKHMDIYPNCKHVCKVLQKRPRSAIASMSSQSPRPVGSRRRLFSE